MSKKGINKELACAGSPYFYSELRR